MTMSEAILNNCSDFDEARLLAEAAMDAETIEWLDWIDSTGPEVTYG